MTTDWPADVRTLAVDVGGSGFKAAVLDPRGTMLTERARVDTPYPCPPATFVAALGGLVDQLTVDYHRVSVGFPGLVRHGRVYNIPSLSRREYGGLTDPELGHAQFRKGETFEDQLGNMARKEVGNERWTARLLKALDAYDRFLF